MSQNKQLPIFLWIVWAIISSVSVSSQNVPVGFANLNGNATGGKGGDKITVKTRNELLSAVKTTVPRIITIQDTIDLHFGEFVKVTGSNISIIGKGNHAMLRYGGLQLIGNNIIVQNLSIGDSYTPGHWDGKSEPYTDAITVYGTNIWIDHCDLFYSHDGLLDFSNIKNNCADYVTVSWTRFSNHNKVMLVGSSDKTTMCRDRFHITIHHCWFDGTSTFYDPVDKQTHRVQQRMPRVRFGQVHVYNNYYEEVADYAIAARFESSVVVENCFFRNLEDPIIMDDFGKGIRDPELVSRGNIFENVKHDPVTSGQAFDPSGYYKYSMDPAISLPALVMNNAGKFNRTDNQAPVAMNDTIDSQKQETFTIYPLQNDFDPDGDSIRISNCLNHPDFQIVVEPHKLVLTKVRKEPEAKYPLTLVYEIIDFQGGKASGSIFLK